MVYPRAFSPCPVIILILLFHLSQYFSATEEAHNNGGFSVNLIRKNTPRAMGSSPNTVQSPVSAYIGHYLMEVSIGTPPVKIYGIADTGSDLTWTQCVPCINCYKQLNPLFDPRKSSTYTNIPCNSELCHKLDTGVCSPQGHLCNYTYAYASSDVTRGSLAQETITLTSSTTGEPVPLKGIVFGCGHNDTGTFNDHEMGIIGLGRGPASLVSQIGPLFGGMRFSQCLVPFHTDISISSKLSIGRGSEVYDGDGVVSTPLVHQQAQSLYFVTLLGITVGVGGRRRRSTYLPFGNSSGSSVVVAKGNMMIDSGTPPTIFPQQLYDRFVPQVRNRVALKPITDDPSLGFQLCYRTTTNLKGPNVMAHFEGGNVLLTPTQLFISPKDGVFCLGVTNASSDGGIFGNFAQSNYLIGFDLERQMVSFKPMDCTKH